MQPTTVQMIKLFLVEATGLAKDALHVHAGLLILFVSAWLLRKPLSSSIPWVVVLLAAIIGELLDMQDDLNGLGFWRWSMSLHDILNTVFWPTVLWVMARTSFIEMFNPNNTHS